MVASQQRRIDEREAEEAETGKKKRGRKPKEPEEVKNKEAKANITDPESRIMKGRVGYVQGYNGQAVVTEGPDNSGSRVNAGRERCTTA